MPPSSVEIGEMSDIVSAGAPENAVGLVMWQMTHRFRRGVGQALRPVDLTHLQFTVLARAAWMSRDARAVAQAEVARYGDIHPMQVSLVLEVLERKAMTRREAGRGAAKIIPVIHGGREALRAALPLTRSVQHRLFGDEGHPGGALLDALLRVDMRQRRALVGSESPPSRLSAWNRPRRSPADVHHAIATACLEKIDLPSTVCRRGWSPVLPGRCVRDPRKRAGSVHRLGAERMALARRLRSGNGRAGGPSGIGARRRPCGRGARGCCRVCGMVGMRDGPALRAALSPRILRTWLRGRATTLICCFERSPCGFEALLATVRFALISDDQTAQPMSRKRT